MTQRQCAPTATVLVAALAFPARPSGFVRRIPTATRAITSGRQLEPDRERREASAAGGKAGPAGEESPSARWPSSGSRERSIFVQPHVLATKAHADHVMARWGDIRLDRVEHGDIQRWLAGLASDGQSGASVRKAHGVLSSVLDLAVKERRLATNPSNGVNLPALSERGRRYLTAEQVNQLASHARVGLLPGARPRVLRAAVVRTGRPPRPRRSISCADGSTSSALSPRSTVADSSGTARRTTNDDPCRSPASSSSGSSAVSVPAPPVPPTRLCRYSVPVMSLLRTDPAAAWTAWNADQPDTASSTGPTRTVHHRRELLRLNPLRLINERKTPWSKIKQPHRRRHRRRVQSVRRKRPGSLSTMTNLGGRREPDIVIEPRCRLAVGDHAACFESVDNSLGPIAAGPDCRPGPTAAGNPRV